MGNTVILHISPNIRYPAGTRHCNDVELMSMRRNDVALTSVRRHDDVMCPLGKIDQELSLFADWISRNQYILPTNRKCPAQTAQLDPSIFRF